ncbi:IclR family transcriptional regulator [Salinactinospora qingdaonensis]|uniref:IclR family transcriptional regulator n=1 Tax=Salinactinospora qingdaonensis TaxID=702744 RepID=A0ABP7F6H5_9ACTN
MRKRSHRPPARTAPGRSVTSRALSALDAFDHGHRVLSLSEIARRTDLPLATAHRLVAELCEARLLSRRPDGAYEIGARMWRLGLLSPPTMLREAALPYLQDLVLSTGHTVHLAVRDGTRALVIDRLAGSRSLPTRHRPGGWLPLHCTAVGKVLLAYAPADLQDAVMADLTPHTKYTVTDSAVLRRQLHTVQSEQLARSAQEHRMGVSSLAMPITMSGQGVVAALALLAPMAAPRLGDALGPMTAAAAAIGTKATRADVVVDLHELDR